MAAILLVSESTELFRAALTGHDVLTATDDAQLLDVSRARRFDLAVVDLAHSELAEAAAAVATKVVLLSDASEDVTRERLQQSGAHGYLRKLGPARMREDVLSLLDLH